MGYLCVDMAYGLCIGSEVVIYKILYLFCATAIYDTEVVG